MEYYAINTLHNCLKHSSSRPDNYRTYNDDRKKVFNVLHDELLKLIMHEVWLAKNEKCRTERDCISLMNREQVSSRFPAFGKKTNYNTETYYNVIRKRYNLPPNSSNVTMDTAIGKEVYNLLNKSKNI